MKIKIIYLILLIIISKAIYASQGTLSGAPEASPIQKIPSTGLGQTTVTKIIKTNIPLEAKTIGSIQSITQVPHYKPWSWQHIKNLATLALIPTPTAKLLVQKHRAEFRKKLLQDEENAIKNLVDINSSLWKNFEKYDEHYEKVIKTENPNRQYYQILSQEWVEQANKALEERGINPRSIHYLTINEPTIGAKAKTETSAKIPNFSIIRYFKPLFGHKTESSLAFNQAWYDQNIAPLPYAKRQAILSYIAEHEATHFQHKHGLQKSKINVYRQLIDKVPSDKSALTAAQEKIADTFPALQNRESARNALIYFKYGVGYPEHKPDIEIEKSYHDVEYLQKQKQQLQKAAGNFQKQIQQHPINRQFRTSSQELGSKVMNALKAPYRWYKRP